MRWLEQISPIPNHCGIRRFDHGVINPWRVIYDHELFILCNGDARFIVGECEVPCPGPFYMIIPPGTRHISYCMTDSVLVAWCHFDWIWRPTPALQKQRVSYKLDGEVMEEAATVPSLVPRCPLYGAVADLESLSVHRRMVSLFNSENRKKRLVSRAFLLQLLLQLLEPEDETPVMLDREERLAYQTRLSLDEIARQPFREQDSVKERLGGLGCSYYHQARVFKSVYGITPSRYINMLRIEEIKNLLMDAELSVREVAAQMGYDDLAYFSRFFRTHTGCSPAKFRKQ